MSNNLRILCRDHPQRSIALATPKHALVFQYTSTDRADGSSPLYNDPVTPRCQVEFTSISPSNFKNYRTLGVGYGTLGLINLDDDVFICVVTGSSKAATLRPGESVARIDNVDFYCLNQSDREDGLYHESESQFAAEDLDRDPALDDKDIVTDHPFLALKKLLSDGSFYYSLDFNLTDRLQDRSDKSAAFDIETLDEDLLWNSHMINSLLLLRSHLPPLERSRLDASQILTCAIRGFSGTLTIPASLPVLPHIRTNLPSTLTIISRQSSRHAGTRFNSRGIDDDGNVANFVETELIFWTPPGVTFSYVQVRGSVPIFWEQTAGFLPGQQKIEVTRSNEATWHAFNKHFESLQLEYGAVHVVNLLSKLKSGEAELSAKFREHIARSLRRKPTVDSPSEHSLLRLTEFDFNAEAQGPLGYAAGDQLRHELANSLNGFAYFLSEDSGRLGSVDEDRSVPRTSSVILQQEGVFRTNCLDCLDRTNLVQTIVSSMALDSFLVQQGGRMSSEIKTRHSTLWADNGDALSKIYAGTGALKSSFTRHGKMSLAGALADARKSATRLYVNNFADKARQRTIDLLLGSLPNQMPVPLHDPVNDIVSEELSRRASEYSFAKTIRLWVGSFNVSGRNEGPGCDLTPWLFPASSRQDDDPTIFAVGFQEIVELSPQQIMSTDPSTRKVWEQAVNRCLNSHSTSRGSGNYVLLRSGQLVGAALLIFVKEEALKEIKNVEGSVIKTGLSGIGGNKGGCGIRFEYSNTKICFVTAHLASGFANYDERNSDYETICHGLRFQKNKSIEDHDAIMWLGDFNYRIGLSNQKVRELISEKQYSKLYDNDQLNLQMIAGAAFRFYSEGPIGFPPTYKFDIGRNEYDTSEKGRIPAWCDRILWRGSTLRETHYNVADLRFSDHRPVWAGFECVIDVVDEELKDKIRRLLYTERQRQLCGTIGKTSRNTDTSDGEVIPHRPIAPGFPSASSDHLKGAPVRSAVTPPAVGFVPNIQRKSNPFSSDDRPDWVSGSRSAGRQREMHVDPGALQRPPLPPRRGTQDSPTHWSSLAGKNAGRSEADLIGCSADRLPASAHRDQKVPPPIPRKPGTLSSRSSTPGRSTPNLIPGRGHQLGMPQLPVRPTNDDWVDGSRSVKGNRRFSSDDPSASRRLSDVARSHGDSLAKSTQNDGANRTNLLDDGGEEVAWKSLLP